MDFIVLDLVSLQAAFVLAFFVRHGISQSPYAATSYRAMAIVLTALALLVCVLFNTMYDVLNRSLYDEFKKTFAQVSFVLGGTLVYVFAVQLGETYSRITVFLTALFYLVISFATRLIWKGIINTRTMPARASSMILIAPSWTVLETLHGLEGVSDRKVVGVVCTDCFDEGAFYGNVPVVSDLSHAARYICREWVDEVFVYDAVDYAAISSKSRTEENTREEIATLMERCREMGVPVHSRLPLYEGGMGEKAFVEHMGDYMVMTTSNNYVTPRQALLKRLLDIFGGLVGSVLALLVIATVGFRVRRESPGPILFKQTRIGLNGKKFTMYKLRSMYMDAEERKQELLDQNRVQDGMMFKLDFDPRIIGNEVLPDGTQKTGIGEFVRRTSLDEFPQFFNVLKGDMSLVGTRPPTEDEWEKYEYHHRARLSTKPGITGLWQVSGRSEITDFEEVVRLDTEYIQNWSIGLDLKILVKTVGAVLKHDGAM